MGDQPYGGPERRRHSRVLRKLPFYCYLDGQRFDGETSDISQAGAFLVTSASVPLEGRLLMVPKGIRSKKPPLLVVAQVVRRETSPCAGLGIGWSKVICRHGFAGFVRLRENVPSLFPDNLPDPTQELRDAPVVAYSFVHNSLYAPKLHGTAEAQASPPAGEVPERVAEPNPFVSSRGTGPVSSLLGYENVQIPVEIPVQVKSKGRRFDGTVVSLGLSGGFVAMPGFTVDDLNKAGLMTVSLPIVLTGREARVKLLCEVAVVGRDPRTRLGGASVAIRGVAQDRSPGLFERYIKFLYYRMINDA